jgi:hypothetical protein
LPISNGKGVGWCTSPVGLLDSPEVEVLCGGVNSKGPDYAAVWRQGHLLHFGFEDPPHLLTRNGQALLLNAIAYIARFRDDRRLPVTPTGFSSTKAPRQRHWLRYSLDQGKVPAIAANFEDPWATEVGKLDINAAREWVEARWGFLVAGESGRLTVDEAAMTLGIAVDADDLPQRALAWLDEPNHAAASVRLLGRSCPDGPGLAAGIGAWRTWLGANHEFLFFTESAGQRWLLDALAKERGVPTAKLRGPARASPVGKQR